MTVTVVEHPLAAHKISVLRNRDTPSWLFRKMVHELTDIVAVAATAHVKTTQVSLATPVSPTTGMEVTPPGPIVIPILRAGVSMLESVLTLLPVCEVGFFGTKRDEMTLLPAVYMNRIPPSLVGRQVLIIDAMLATGGSLILTLEEVAARGATDVTCICLISAKPGVSAVETCFERLGLSAKLFVAAIDDELTPQGYITPGLGDAGDRLFGAF